MPAANRPQPMAHGHVAKVGTYARAPISESEASRTTEAGIRDRRAQLNALADHYAERGDHEQASAYRAQAGAL